MDVLKKVIAYLKSQIGIVGVFEMDDTISSDILRIERSIRTRSEHDYISVGYDIAMERKHRLCVFYTNDFQKDMRLRLKLETEDGTVIGTNILKGEAKDYSGREDILWVSDDFVVFPDVQGKGEERFILYPYDYTELHEVAPGCSNAIGISPTLSSDLYLKEHAGTSGDGMAFTTIVAFDD